MRLLHVVWILCGLSIALAAQANDLEAARKLLESGQAAAALDQLRPGYAKGGREPERLRLMGKACMRTGQVDDAAGYFRTVAEGATAKPADQVNLAWARHEQAVAQLTRDPGLAKAAFLDAADAARRGVRGEPGNLAGWRFFTASLERAGKPEEAADAYRDGLVALGDAGRPLRLDAAAFEARRGRTEAALALLEPLKKAPDAQVARARVWAEAGRLDRAGDHLTAVLLENPADAAAHAELIRRFNTPSSRKRGVMILQAVAKAHPENLYVLKQLGYLHGAAGDLDAAEATLQRCVNLAPADPWAYPALGSIYRRRAEAVRAAAPIDRGRLQETLKKAIVFYVRGIEVRDARAPLDPADTNLVNTLGQVDRLIFELGDAKEAGDPAAAGAAIQPLLERYPGHAPFLHTQALMARDLGQFEVAEKAFRAAIDACPKDNDWFRAQYLNNIGLLYEAANRYDDAEAEYARAAALSGPGRLDGNENLGKLAFKLGNPKKALGFFKAVLDEDPDRAASLFYYHLCRRRIQREIHYQGR